MGSAEYFPPSASAAVQSISNTQEMFLRYPDAEQELWYLLEFIKPLWTIKCKTNF